MNRIERKGVVKMLAELLTQVQIDQQIALVAPALMVLGYALKRTPMIYDWLIIWILLFFGILASVITLGFSVNGIANGAVAAGVAITTHQAYKQSKNRN